MSNHTAYKDLLSIHALNALDEAEARPLEDHLRTCAECRAELDTWRETSAELAYASPLAEPSSGLRQSIIEKARTLEQPARRRTTSARTMSSGVTRGDALPKEAKVVRMPDGTRRAWQSREAILAIAASLIIAALAVSLIIQQKRNRELSENLARLSTQLETSKQELAKAQQDIDFLNAPTLAMLKGTAMASNAEARLMYDRKTGKVMLAASNLPPAPAGKAYQLWYIAGDRPMPGGVFTPDASGRSILRDQMPAGAQGATLFAVTLEPSGGVASPTGEKYLLGPPT